MKTSSSKRFTLIELLVVIAIIIILSGLVFPALGTVRNNAKKTKASSECQGLKTALVMYESEFSCWPAQGTSDAVVTGANYDKLCKALLGEKDYNPKNMVFYEGGTTYKDGEGILDPWGQQYQIILDFDYDGMISETPTGDQGVVKSVNKYNNRSGNLRTRVAVFSFGVKKDDKSTKDELAKRKKIVTSW